MRRTGVVGAAVIVWLGGCEDAPTTPAGAGGTTHVSTSVGATTVVNAVSVGAGGGDGNNLPSQAVELGLGAERGGALERFDDVDFYRVVVTEPGLHVFEVDAQPDHDPLAAGYIDAVLTLYLREEDAQRRQAENDDPWPRTTQDSELITELLPGEYVLRVSDHCHWRQLEQGDPCDGPATFDDPTYVVSARRWSVDEAGLVGVGEAPVVTFAEDATVPRGYARPLIWNRFDGTTADTYALSIPSDWVLTTHERGRPAWIVSTLPAGSRGSGATVETGLVWLSDRSDSDDPTATVLGVVDASLDPGRQLIVPATGPSSGPGGSFSQTDAVFVHVSASDPATGSRPFYLLRIDGAATAPWEDEPNDSAPGAVLLPGAGLSYAVGGELPPGDVDWFSLDLATEGIPVNYFVDAQCTARGRGSGIEGLTLALVDDDGVTVAHQGQESVDGPARAGGGPVLLPAGSSAFYLRVSGQGQAPNNDASYYHCELRFLAP